MIQSNNWRYTISIKNKFQDEVTEELVTELCNSLIKQLEVIKVKTNNSMEIDVDEKMSLNDRLTEIIDHFEFLNNLANYTIQTEDWHKYNFDGDFEELFNDYLTQLYDLADERILLNGGITEKFIWID